MATVYLGSRYSRREELLVFKADLESRGYEVTSRWLGGEYGDLVGKTGEVGGNDEARVAAEHDIADIEAADCVVIFTDPPGQGGPKGRGGFHVEFGIALEAGKRLLLIGHRLSSFHHLGGVIFYPNWHEALRHYFCLPGERADDGPYMYEEEWLAKRDA
jgi:hypothetical protein